MNVNPARGFPLFLCYLPNAVEPWTLSRGWMSPPLLPGSRSSFALSWVLSVTRISVARTSWGFSSRSFVGSAHIYQTPWPLPEPRPGTRRPPKLPASTRWQLRSALPMWHNFLEFTSPHLALIICWLVIVVICLKALSSLPDCKPLLCLLWQHRALGGEEILVQPCPNQCARDPESPTKNPITNIWRWARFLTKSPAIENDFPVFYFHRCESKGLCF